MPDGGEAAFESGTYRLLRWLTRRRFTVADRSMLPTLEPGDRLYVDRRAFRTRPPSRGELVVARESEPPHRYLVKRVAYVAGDTVPPAGTQLLTGSVYLLGDNAGQSRDSRQFGPFPLRSIVGRVYRCYLPAERRREFASAEERLKR